MALITCPDCGSSVSDAASACIHCGRPLAAARPAAAIPAAPAAGDPMDRRAQERAERVAQCKRIAIVVYVLQVLAFLYFIPAVAGVILAYLKRADARGTWVESHFDWQIGTFWISLWLCVGAVVAAVTVALATEVPMFALVAVAAVGLGATVWYVYRIIRGGLALNDEQPVG